MKTKKNKPTACNTRIRFLLLLMIVFLLQSFFVACSGPPSSAEQEQEMIEYSYWPREEFTEIPSRQPLPPIVIPDIEWETDTESPQEKQTASTVTYVASRESDKYHRLSCHYVDQILKENRVYYKTEEAARRAGKSPCSVCKP